MRGNIDSSYNHTGKRTNETVIFAIDSRRDAFEMRAFNKFFEKRQKKSRVIRKGEKFLNDFAQPPSDSIEPRGDSYTRVRDCVVHRRGQLERLIT